MTWKFVPTDDIPLYHLLKAKEFYDDDLRRAEESVERAERWRKYNLPNWRSNLINIQLAVIEAKKNINLVNEAIEIAKKRNL